MASRPAVVCRHHADADIAFDQRQTASKLRSCTRSRNGASGSLGLVRQKALQRAGPVQADKIIIEQLRKADRSALASGCRGDHQHEAVGAKRLGLQTCGIDGSGDDADITGPLGDQPDDLVAEPLLKINAHLRVGGQKRA